MAVELHAHTMQPSACLLEDCSERWATYFNVFSQQGTCTVARRCPELRSPNLEWRCPPHSAAPRLYACFPGMVVSLLWFLPRSEGYSFSILQEFRGILPRGACLTWPAKYACGYNGSYRRGLSQPIDFSSSKIIQTGCQTGASQPR